MFNDAYIATFTFGEIYYVLETFYCVQVETDYEDFFIAEFYLN